MPYDLNTMTRFQLEKLRSDVDTALKKAADRDRKAALKAAEKAVKPYGFSLADITSPTPTSSKKRKGGKRVTSARAAKYANPNDPSQTWSGMGRKPGWFNEALEAGTDPGEMEIHNINPG